MIFLLFLPDPSVYGFTGVLIMLIPSFSFWDDTAKVLSTAPVLFRDGSVNYFSFMRLSNKLIKQSLCERAMAHGLLEATSQ